MEKEEVKRMFGINFEEVDFSEANENNILLVGYIKVACTEGNLYLKQKTKFPIIYSGDKYNFSIIDKDHLTITNKITLSNYSISFEDLILLRKTTKILEELK